LDIVKTAPVVAAEVVCATHGARVATTKIAASKLAATARRFMAITLPRGRDGNVTGAAPWLR
jgi:hypothetical protein